MALLSVGDYGLLSWMPSLLSRRFALPPAKLGLLFGVITAVAGVAGALAGGILSDRAERRGGARARLVPIALAAAAGALAAAMVSGGLTMVFLGLALWTLASAIGGIGGIAALQELLPNEYRGVGISLVAFCNTLLGLGVGPTLVALATEQVYGDPMAVGHAMTLVVLPAGVVACLLFIICRHALRGAAGTVAEA
jgi:MFS family permease